MCVGGEARQESVRFSHPLRLFSSAMENDTSPYDYVQPNLTVEENDIETYRNTALLFCKVNVLQDDSSDVMSIIFRFFGLSFSLIAPLLNLMEIRAVWSLPKWSNQMSYLVNLLVAGSLATTVDLPFKIYERINKCWTLNYALCMTRNTLSR